MNTKESISQAFSSINQFKLRASLTLLSIAIGVFAIMGVGTLMSSLDNAVTNELSDIGENTFMFRKFPAIVMGNTWRKYVKRKAITYSQYEDFKKQVRIPQMLTAESVSSFQVVKSANYSTDPDVRLLGTDEGYFPITNAEVEKGRVFSEEDITLNRNVAIIGNDIVVKIFQGINPIGQKVKIKNQSYTVVGVLESKGAILGQSQDNIVIIPITQFLKYYASVWEESLSITVKAPSKAALVPAMDECIGVLRVLRNDHPGNENSFEIITNDSIGDSFGVFTNTLSVFGMASGIIALIAAGVGIMNIMLVSVKERTREIGIRKAVGAKKSWIMKQFIIEAVTLCQIGGLIGIIMGFIVAYYLGNLMNITISFSLFWFVLSLFICTIIGITFGAFPALKAANLDPIDALRYE